MASKAEDSPPKCDDSWIMIDDMPENVGEVDESVLNPMSARARYMNNLMQRMWKLKPKRSASSSSDEQESRRQSDNLRGSVMSALGRLRSKSISFADKGKKQKAQDER